MNIFDLFSVCGVDEDEGVLFGEHLHHCHNLQALSIENRDRNRKQIKLLLSNFDILKNVFFSEI